MKLAHRHLFAVLFSFQRTIALSDLISLSRHFSFVKQIFLFFLRFFRAVCRLTDGGYYPIILFLFCQPDFFRFYRHFRFCSHLPLPTAPPPPSPTSGDGFRFVYFPLFSIIRGRLFCMSHFIVFRFYLYKISFISVYCNKNGLFQRSFPFSKVLIEISSQNHFCML